MEPSETLDTLQARHRKEQRDLVARITQKKKAATKKTRKGVNEECERLEQEMKERQAEELAALDSTNSEEEEQEEEEAESDAEAQTNTLQNGVASLAISPSPTNEDTVPAPDSQAAAKKKPNRAKARLARRAAEQEALVEQARLEAASLPNLREQEREQMQTQFQMYKLHEKEIRADGHCLYAAVADQMENSGLGLKPRIPVTVVEEGLPVYKKVRYAAAEWIEKNPEDFAPFIDKPLPEYLQKIRETGEWGGHVELLALAKIYGVDIHVLHGDGRVDKIESEGEGSGIEEKKVIWLGYYRHGFGLGEHYNSLRKSP
ncbi:OTU-domain-containing protein [Amniculicola lignicola CBS 123094]|uniref:OTU-domain-containing protein n=1 Tax=Amniculicola lignicola CBS 123094 TaxID=1392246 RepID=A0A6A5X576_9PLEO|nr:OTU-domain-containing protein [Amniculicola lignicola CBS 123094]